MEVSESAHALCGNHESPYHDALRSRRSCSTPISGPYEETDNRLAASASYSYVFRRVAARSRAATLRSSAYAFRSDICNASASAITSKSICCSFREFPSFSFAPFASFASSAFFFAAAAAFAADRTCSSVTCVFTRARCFFPASSTSPCVPSASAFACSAFAAEKKEGSLIMSRSAAAASVVASSLSTSDVAAFASAAARSSSKWNTLTSASRSASRRAKRVTRRQLSSRNPPSTPLSAIAATSAETFDPLRANCCS